MATDNGPMGDGGLDHRVSRAFEQELGLTLQDTLDDLDLAPEDNDLFDDPVSTIGLPAEIVNSLTAAKIEKVADLATRTVAQLLAVAGIDQQALETIRRCLQAEGLSLMGEEEWEARVDGGGDKLEDTYVDEH